MATVHKLPGSPWRAIIESAFFANSVKTTTMADLYGLASKQPEVIKTSIPLLKPELLGLPKSAKVLVSNDGKIVGRTAKARFLARSFDKAESDAKQVLLREAVFQLNTKPSLKLEAIVGLHPDFMVKAHLLSPVTDAKNMLDWGFNFAPFIPPWSDKYTKSRKLGEPDILVLADPDWSHPDYPDGCVIIDEQNNCTAILGLRYFGERKKGTLTLAWTMGVRHNMVACHGGIKKIGNAPPVAVFGLSGSGKSSITNSLDHEGNLKKSEKVTVIHDDAFLIDLENDFSVALEPSLFDKTDAVSFDDSTMKYFYSAQNVAVTKTPQGKICIVAEDVRNNNGRCLKSRDMFRHKDYCERPGKLIWLQKDTSLPPISKVTNNALAVAMGASLSTMRAKGVENVDAAELKKLVIEPFANPFRVHPLMEDCDQFHKLFRLGCECYIMNTHAFGIAGSITDIPKELSLKIVTELVREKIEWSDWRTFSGLKLPKNGKKLFGTDYDKLYKPSKKEEYLGFLRDRVQDRIKFLSDKRDLGDMQNCYIAHLVFVRTTIDRILTPDLFL